MKFTHVKFIMKADLHRQDPTGTADSSTGQPEDHMHDTAGEHTQTLLITTYALVCL